MSVSFTHLACFRKDSGKKYLYNFVDAFPFEKVICIMLVGFRVT